jgi:hypothetical protein
LAWRRDRFLRAKPPYTLASRIFDFLFIAKNNHFNKNSDKYKQFFSNKSCSLTRQLANIQLEFVTLEEKISALQKEMKEIKTVPKPNC